MGRMQACLVEVFERIVTALLPCVLAFFLFNELIDRLSGERMSRPLLAQGNGLELCPSIDIQTDGHWDCGDCHGVYIQLVAV